MDDTQSFTIGELADAAGTTSRTIRYYTAEGLLPAPDTRGKYARYSRDHLLRLQLIARLKDSYLPLSAIRERLDGLSTAAIEQLLSEGEPRIVAESAAEYLAHVLEEPQPMPQPAYALPPPMPAAAPAPGGSVAQALAESPMRTGGLLQKLMPRRRAHADPPMEHGEQWRRIELAPGVELHTREPLAEDMREPVTRLIEKARELLG